MMTSSSTPQFDDPLSHEGYFELCALATSGSLTDQEWCRLQAHLVHCEDCRKQVQEYREVARTGIALLMPDLGPDGTATAQQPQEWSPERAKRELFSRISRGDTGQNHRLRSRTDLAPQVAWWRWLFRPALQSTLRYAAALVLLAALTFSAYHVGSRKGEQVAGLRGQSSAADARLMSAELIRLRRERVALDESLKARSTELDSVSKELRHQMAEVEKWKALQTKTVAELDERTSAAAGLQARFSSLSAERDAVSLRRQESEVALQAVQKQFDALRDERSAELLHTASLEKRIEDLTARLTESEATSHQAQQFLASDRDIRELMGARDLYVADVFDVGENGKTQQAFGRVFYTKGKSLIFYAFDLDRQPHLRDAATFQAWGRRGQNDNRPVDMGIFYLDNAIRKRWVLKFDDPQALAQIDAVFVTVEPQGGSPKPRGKQLLFASLRSTPNHP